MEGVAGKSLVFKSPQGGDLNYIRPCVRWCRKKQMVSVFTQVRLIVPRKWGGGC